MADVMETQQYETSLTPELAAELLAKRHPRQRRTARSTVSEYARRIREGRWRLVPDPIMVDTEGRLFNGGHRCEAVIAANRAIPVYILHGVDESLFDVIDVGRFRSPYQFIPKSDATVRASATRLTLWYERRFENPPAAPHLTFDLNEILAEEERRSDAFDAVTILGRRLYEYTSIAKSVAAAVFAIAYDMGYMAEIEEFVQDVCEPQDLDAGDPARLLAERFRRQLHRSSRRQNVVDWTLLTYSLNLRFEGQTMSKLILSDVWPRVGEPLKDYRRRANVVHAQRDKVRRDGLQRALDHRPSTRSA